MHLRDFLKRMRFRMTEFEREARQKHGTYGPDFQPLERPEAEWGRLYLHWLNSAVVKREEP